jgi:lysyl-tRNA synthetase, class II
MSEEDLYEARLRKAEEFRQAGQDPWSPNFDRTHLATDLHERFADLAPGESSGESVRVAGRLRTARRQGRLGFGDLVDVSGKVQLFCTGEATGILEHLDVGDLVGASGEVVRTKRGELSVQPTELTLLAKSLRPPPDKWHGLRDVELRYRHRYLDLLANPEARRLAELRPQVVRTVRAYLDARGFLEVETPILHPIPGGAAARPFVTHHNALDIDLYLRIAKELYLKRLIVGGFERVYEIGRVFRNEGISYKHNPEFTMLEAYQAYADYLDMMELVQDLVQTVTRETLGGTRVTFEGHEIDFGGQWPRVRYLDAVREATGEPVGLDTPLDALRDLCARHGIDLKPWWGPGMLLNELYEHLVEPNLIQPTIVYDYPLEISPLARTHREDPILVGRFEPIVAGRELGNAFSELNDPIEQRRSLEAQAALRAQGDLEANPVDEPYLYALEHGMPPTGGLGVGIDRLVMLLGGVHSIREVVLFPTLRPQRPGDEDQD